MIQNEITKKIFICDFAAKYQAGIITISLGNGKKLDSINIKITIQMYHNWSTEFTRKIAISCSINFFIIFYL